MSKRREDYVKKHSIEFELSAAQMKKLKPLHDAIMAERTTNAGVVIVQLHNESFGKAVHFPDKYAKQIHRVTLKCLEEMAKEKIK